MPSDSSPVTNDAPFVSHFGVDHQVEGIHQRLTSVLHLSEQLKHPPASRSLVLVSKIFSPNIAKALIYSIMFIPPPQKKISVFSSFASLH